MQKAGVVCFAVLMGLLLTGAVGAQAIRGLPTPTPSPRATPSPAPTPPPAGAPCPSVTVQPQGPQPLVDGQSIAFMANIMGGDTKVQPTILWTTSAGSIKIGQYTRHIEVDSTGAGQTPDRELKAEIWVGGYAPECVVQAWATVKIIPPAVKFGEFGELPAEQVAFHLKTLAQYMGQSPDNLYLIVYAGRKSDRNFTMSWVKKIKDELINNNKVEPRRILAMDGGFREDPAFEFWLVPAGAQPPRPTPTVDRREIVYPKPTPVPPPVKKP
jgi:hypothetical protein